MQDNLTEVIKEIKNCVRFPSIKDKGVKNAPFGKPMAETLEYFLSLAEKLGFETYNYSNYCGEVVFGEGEDKKGLAILCHLDVVPIGNLKEWIYPPFSATEENGKIYGRGTIDDKSPAVICLFALKKLKDESFIPNRKIKLILGCDEESGWKCMEHYNKVAVMCDEGFSPDGDFPVIYAEKGIIHAELKFDKPENIYSINGGERVNVVCDNAETVINNLNIEKLNAVKIENDIFNKIYFSENTITAKGKTAHGSTPEQGENAIEKLLLFLVKAGIGGEKIYKSLFIDVFKLKEFKDETGYLTFSPNIIRSDEKNIYVTVDIRYPSTICEDVILKELEKIAPYQIKHKQKPLLVDKNSDLVTTLLQIYNKESGKKESPVAIGGGTYARCLKRGVAFGPTHISEPSRCHMPNEYVSLKEIEFMFNVYYKAIKKLCE